MVLLVFGVVASLAAARKFTLVIDAGHGGHDAGAVGAFSKEKDINLRTALAFGRYVERNCPDVNVVYTRKTDVFVTLHGRADIANKAKADLFISIHTNALPGKQNTARGLETYTLGMHRAGDNLDVAKRENSVILVEKDYRERYQGFDPNSAESYIIFEFMQDNNMHRSVDLAKLVQRNVCSTAGRPDKGVKQAGFLVLRETSMPSCLIELGFISTPSEERLLNDEASVDNIARGIYQAFVAYKRDNDDGGTSVAVGEPRQQPSAPATTSSRRQQQPDAVPAQSQPASASAPSSASSPSSSKGRATGSTPKASENTDAPVFKVQIFVSDKVLKENDSRFKGEKGAQYYKEGGMTKYTLGESANFNEINQLRRTLNEKFPGCFVVAFKNGDKMDVNEAIREFRNRKK